MTVTVRPEIAIERMWIYASGYSVVDREAMQARIRKGEPVTYTAYDHFGRKIGQTTITVAADGEHADETNH